MSPPALDIQPYYDESIDTSPSGSESDVDDVPPIKFKMPLREQYKVTAPQTEDVDIDWNPSFPKYLQRVKLRLKNGVPSVPLPSGFPLSVKGGPCWSAKDLNTEDLIHHLNDDHLGEIDQALQHFSSLKIGKNDINHKNFPLFSLADVLAKMSRQVHSGTGVCILRGLDPSKYSFADNVIIYAGIASHVGNIRGKQDKAGNILVHIKDVGSKIAPDDKRQSPYANNAQPFHNDLGDIIALYCMDKAMVGGVSKLAPAATVYNELAAHRPDLIHELAASNWAFDKNDGSQSYRDRPILFRDACNDRAFFCFSRRQLTGSTVSPKPSYLPKLTEGQAEALDAVHFTAEKHALEIHLEKGDIQFSNNLALFHAREAFKDGIDSNKRHLIRMWLRNEELAWPTPLELCDVWDEIYGNQRPSIWHMSPTHEHAHVINRSESCHG